MKKKYIFSGLFVTTIFAATWLYFFYSEPDSTKIALVARENININRASSSSSSTVSLSKSSAPFTADAQQGTVEPVELKEEWVSEINESFTSAAEAYADEIKYPSYSRPLSIADSQLLRPNGYFPQDIPLEDGGTANIQLSKYRYFFPEPITVRLNVAGIDVSDASLKLFSTSNTELLASTTMNAINGGFEAELLSKTSWNGLLKIEILFSSKSKTQVLQTEFEYRQPVARVTGVGDTYVDGANMVIPVHLNVEQSGTYRLSANLFTESKSPLALLTQSEKLSSGEKVLELRAHKSVLQEYSGPFWLTTFQLELRSAAPGQLSQYGISVAQEFSIPYIELRSLADEHYQPNEQELQRMEFLKEMEGND